MPKNLIFGEKKCLQEFAFPADLIKMTNDDALAHAHAHLHSRTKIINQS